MFEQTAEIPDTAQEIFKQLDTENTGFLDQGAARRSVQ
jgi:hypothetical protein